MTAWHSQFHSLTYLDCLTFKIPLPHLSWLLDILNSTPSTILTAWHSKFHSLTYLDCLTSSIPLSHISWLLDILNSTSSHILTVLDLNYENGKDKTESIGCEKSCARRRNVRQQFTKYAKFLETVLSFPYQVCFNFLAFTFTLLSSLVENYFVFVYLNLLTWMSRQYLLFPLLFLDQIYLIKSFNAFILDNNFCFFEHADEVIPDFIHRIYDDSKWNLEPAIWSWAIF